MLSRPKHYAPNKGTTPRSDLAGLQFEVEAVDDYVRTIAACESGFAFQVRSSAPVYLTAVLETITADILEQSDKPQGVATTTSEVQVATVEVDKTDTWACKMCSFVNDADVASCPMCDSPKPDSNDGETSEWSCPTCTFENGKEEPRLYL